MTLAVAVAVPVSLLCATAELVKLTDPALWVQVYWLYESTARVPITPLSTQSDAVASDTYTPVNGALPVLVTLIVKLAVPFTRTLGVEVVLVIDIPGTVTITPALPVAVTVLVAGGEASDGVLVEVAVPLTTATLVSAEVTPAKLHW